MTPYDESGTYILLYVKMNWSCNSMFKINTIMIKPRTMTDSPWNHACFGGLLLSYLIDAHKTA